MKTLIGALILLGTSQVFANVIICDRGDDWHQQMESIDEVVGCDWSGFGLCYDGNAYKTMKQYVSVGKKYDVTGIGPVKVKAGQVKNRKIDITLDVNEDLNYHITIGSCRK